MLRIRRRYHGITGTIQEPPPSEKKVWHVWARQGQPHHACVIPVAPILIKPDQPLVIKLIHYANVNVNVNVNVNLGRFRLQRLP